LFFSDVFEHTAVVTTRGRDLTPPSVATKNKSLAASDKNQRPMMVRVRLGYWMRCGVPDERRIQVRRLAVVGM
jgi:hypothetical protein